jgi:hypothetical protein
MMASKEVGLRRLQKLDSVIDIFLLRPLEPRPGLPYPISTLGDLENLSVDFW